MIMHETTILMMLDIFSFHLDKPKIFLIQACRGQRDNDVMATRVEHSQAQLKRDGETMPLKPSMGILRESWYVEAYSTPKNYVAFR